MVSALPSDQYTAQVIEQMRTKRTFLEEHWDDHEKEIEEKLAQEQRRFDAAVEGSVQACEAIKQSIAKATDPFHSSFASADITGQNGKQIEHLKEVFKELTQSNAELLGHCDGRKELLRNLREKTAKTQKSLAKV